MASNTLFTQVREGMQAQSVDGKVLGKVTGVSTHDTETYLEVTPGFSLPVWLHLSHHLACMYLPASAITAVSGNRVTLGMDVKLAKGGNLRPNWFVGPKTANLHYW